MAMAGRIRSGFSLLNRISRSDSLSSGRSNVGGLQLIPKMSRGFAAASAQKEEKVKVPVALYGGSGNYASALYLAAVKSNALEKVESEILNLVEATKASTTFAQFMKDLSVPKDQRLAAVKDICDHAKFSDVTKNFLVLLAENGRLKNVDTIAKRFSELTMAHRGDVKVLVTTVMPLPPAEEKELRETLQDVIGHGKKVIVEEKIDTSILGGLIVQFGQKVLDMSIKTRAKQMERLLREPIDLSSL